MADRRARLKEKLDRLVRECCEAFDFHRLYVNLYNFCTADLSAYYLDIRKDALYCDGVGSTGRRAARTVVDRVFDCLVTWLAPVLCFTTEEAWLSRGNDAAGSVHLQLFPEIPADWRDDALAEKWEKVRRLRRVVTGALEVERREKRIGASLQAHPVVYARASDLAAMAGVDLAEIAITSTARLVEGEAPVDAFGLEGVDHIGVVVEAADGGRCGRCWKVLAEVPAGLPEERAAEALCGRCTAVVATFEAAAE